MDASNKIYIRDLHLKMQIGIYKREKGHKQPVILNAEIYLEPGKRWHNAKIAETFDYDEIIKRVENISLQKHYDLIETFLEVLADDLLSTGKITGLKLAAEKPRVAKSARSMGVEIIRTK